MRRRGTMLRNLLGSLLTLGLLGQAVPAHSALIHNFVDTFDGTIVGSIEFSAETPGVVTAFSFSGFGGPVLGLGDLCLTAADCDLAPAGNDTVWSIDNNWNLNGFAMLLDFGDSFDPGSDVEMLFEFNDPASIGLPFITQFVSGSPPAGALTLYRFRNNQRLQTVAVEVPEPTSFALFSVGLAGLAFARRRRAAARS